LPYSQAGGLPLVGCLRLLIEYVCSYPPYLEEAPYHGDRDPPPCYVDLKITLTSLPEAVDFVSWQEVHNSHLHSRVICTVFQ